MLAKVFEAGRGDPLLYLHGANGLQDFEPWLERLAEGYRVIAPQHPGFGESTGLENIDDLLDLAIYYLDFLDATGISGAHLLGHAFGGMLAAEIAALDRSYVNKLVLVDALGFWLDDQPVLDIFATPARELGPLMWHDPDSATARAVLAPPGEPTPEQQMRAVIERTKALSTTGKFIWPIPDKGLKKRIHRINAPTLVVWGASDRVVPPAYGQLFQQKIAGARLVTIPEAGHLPMQEQPDRFLQAVAEFLG
jgi:pimeloyl-ACP methyl ester carboxylesterase